MLCNRVTTRMPKQYYVICSSNARSADLDSTQRKVRRKLMISDESAELQELSPDLYTSLFEKKPLLSRSFIESSSGNEGRAKTFEQAFSTKATQYKS